MTDWLKYNYNTTTKFSLKNTECYCRVVQIHDGDTITVVLPLLNNFYKFSVRLNGIDTCEIKSENEANQILAQKAKNRLIELVTLTKPDVDIKDYLLANVVLVYIKCNDFDKYGRVLGSVSKSKDDTQTFSELLVKEKLGYVYEGQKKLTEEDQIRLLS